MSHPPRGGRVRETVVRAKAPAAPPSVGKSAPSRPHPTPIPADGDAAEPRPMSLQLKIVNACATGADIPLPMKPTPGALIAFYTQGWEAGLEMTATPPVGALHACSSGRRGEWGTSKDTAVDVDGHAHAEDAGEGRPREVSDGWEGSAVSHGRATVPGLSGAGTRGEGSVSWLRLAAQCRRWRQTQAQIQSRAGGGPAVDRLWGRGRGGRRQSRHTGPLPWAAAETASEAAVDAAPTLSPAQWMQAVPHIVLGRHPLLPDPLRLRHPCIARMHARVVLVENAVVHTCLTCLHPPAPRGVVATFAEPYYLLIRYGENAVFVNGEALPRGWSRPLTAGDVISFLEDALDERHGVFVRDGDDASDGSDTGVVDSLWLSLSSSSDAETSGEGGGYNRSRPSRADSQSGSDVLVHSDGEAHDAVGEESGRSDAGGRGVHGHRHSPDEDGGGRSARSQPLLQPLLSAALRGIVAAHAAASTTRASLSWSSSPLLRLVAGSRVWTVAAASLGVSEEAHWYVRRWCALTAALRGEATAATSAPGAAASGGGRVEGTRARTRSRRDDSGGGRRVRDEVGGPRLLPSPTRARYVVERNHLLVCDAHDDDDDEDHDGGYAVDPADLPASDDAGSRVRDLSVTPRKLKKVVRKPSRGGRWATAARIADAQDSDASDADDPYREQERSGEASRVVPPLTARVESFLRGLARLLGCPDGVPPTRDAEERVHRLEAAAAEGDDGIGGEAPSPLHARLELDREALWHVYRTLRTEAPEVVAQAETAALSRSHSWTGETSGERLQSWAGGSCLATPERPTLEAGLAKEAAAAAAGGGGSPIKELLEQLRRERNAPDDGGRSPEPTLQAGCLSAGAAVAAQRLVSPHPGADKEPRRELLGGVDPRVARHVEQARVLGASMHAATTSACDEEVWEERAEDELVSPVTAEDAGVGVATTTTATITATMAHADSGRGGHEGGGGTLSSSLPAPTPAVPLAELLDPRGEAHRAVPALRLRPARLPVFMLTRRSPSPDLTTRFATRQSRAANRHGADSASRPAYVFYYEEEAENDAVVAVDGEKQEGGRRGPPEVDGHGSVVTSERVGGTDAPMPAMESVAEETRMWVDEEEDERMLRRMARRAPTLARGKSRQTSGAAASATKSRRRK